MKKGLDGVKKISKKKGILKQNDETSIYTIYEMCVFVVNQGVHNIRKTLKVYKKSSYVCFFSK